MQRMHHVCCDVHTTVVCCDVHTTVVCCDVQGKSHGGGFLGKLVTMPFQSFKNAKGKDGILDTHAKTMNTKLSAVKACQSFTLMLIQ